MSDRRTYYYPAIFYAVILVMVWGMSWLNSIIAMFVGGGEKFMSLVSAEGLRWAVRNSSIVLNELPWGTVMLVIAIVGLLRGSGLKRALGHLFFSGALSPNERRAIFFVAIALLLCVLLLFAVTIAPWQLLMAVTGELGGSPLIQGWLPLLSFIVFVVSLVYGFIYGNYRSLLDLVCSVGDTFVISVPALLALIPAAGIVPGIEYMELFGYFGVSGEDVDVFADILYSIPFLYIILLRMLERDRK